MPGSLFAVERYERRGDQRTPPLAALPADSGVRLVVAVHVPADEVVIALVEADDVAAVEAAAVGAGWQVDRVTPAVWIVPLDCA
ncbi:hypothetical protein [Polymorphospora rubra]|uniref:Uncharacterized protein n=1 Tax=Polymorphospora rubra TaxID=338584 RepID=A0A810MXR0_9ACTN|nr:hypothetical protein [Polymorphospora rubra]BCJ64759.1 hypothetical protein Prubr_17800 [Polymorphospora rubra]